MMTVDLEGLRYEVGIAAKWLNTSGLEATVDEEKAVALYNAVSALCKEDSSPEHQELWLVAMMVIDAMLAAKSQPDWQGIARVGTTPTGELLLDLADGEGRMFWAALRLTNNAIARCMCDGKIGTYAEKVACTALDYFAQLQANEKGAYSNSGWRCVAALHVVLAHRAYEPRGVKEHAEQAIRILDSASLSTEGTLRGQAERLLESTRLIRGRVEATLSRVPEKVRPPIQMSLQPVPAPAPAFGPEDICLFRDH